MLARQALAKKALSEKQSGRRKVRADKVRHIRDAQLATLSAAYDIQKQALDLRHAEEIKQQKQEWRDLSAGRDQLWDEWRAEFGIRERPRRQGDGGKAGSRDQGSAGDQGGGGQASAPPARKPPADHFANTSKIPAEKPKRAADLRVQEGIRAGGHARIRIARKPDGNNAEAPRNASWMAVISRGCAKGPHSENVMYGPISPACNYPAM